MLVARKYYIPNSRDTQIFRLFFEITTLWTLSLSLESEMSYLYNKCKFNINSIQRILKGEKYMDRKDRIVHGSYANSKDTVAEIEKLQAQGYTRDQILVYGTAVEDKTFDKTENDPEAPRENRTFDKTEDNSSDKRDDKTFDKTDRTAEDRRDEKTYDKVDRLDTDGDDESLWDKVKDFFTSDSYDHDKESSNPNYRKENDVLYPHRNDLANGNRVIVLDKANENQTRINI